MVGGLLNGWVIELHGEMVQDSDQAGDYIGTEGDWIGKNSRKYQFFNYEISKILLEVCIGSVGCSCFPASDFSCHSRCADRLDFSFSSAFCYLHSQNFLPSPHLSVSAS